MSFDYNLKCRTCLNESNTYYELADQAAQHSNILEMLDSVVPHINIRNSSDFSTLVCDICVEKLVNSYAFQQMCIKSNNILQDMLPILIIKDEEVENTLIVPLADQNITENYEVSNEETNSYHIPFSGNDGASCSISQAELFFNELETKNCTKEDVDMELIRPLGNAPIFQCYYCPKTFEKQNSLAAHSRVHKKSEFKFTKLVEVKSIISPRRKASKRIFPCKICRKIFERPFDLSRHNNTVHSLARPHECKICKYRFSDEKFLRAHLAKHKNEAELKEEMDNAPQIHNEATNDNFNNYVAVEPREMEYKFNDYTDTGLPETKTLSRITKKRISACKICGKIFDRHYDLGRHNKTVHCPDKPHECTICKYRFWDEKSLEAHFLKHSNETDRSHKCEVCQQGFLTRVHLINHFKSNHPEVEKHKCDYCKKTFVVEESLLAHIRYFHEKNEKSLQCPKCEKTVKNGHNLQQHMRVHKSYLCSHCGKTFKGPANYRQHVLRHEGLQKYQCPDCPKRFNCKSNLIHHAVTHSKAKPHVCDICDARFTENYSLLKHKKTVHVAERSFKCNQCSMTFKSIGVLKQHKFTHTGEKPYKCKYCDCAYAQSGELTKHLRIHVGENTYKCGQCPESFKYQVELRNHQSQHYKINQKMEETISEDAQHHE